MSIAVRPMRPDEARLFLEIQGRSVRGLAASHYPRDVIDAWAVAPTDTTVSRFLENADGEIRLVAELEGELVGLGVIVVANSELRACYVVPEAARKGVGTALVREIERIAQEHDLDRLELLASLNAEPFYAALGYESVERTEHVLRNRQPMAAVRMTKNGLTGHGAAQTDGRLSNRTAEQLERARSFGSGMTTVRVFIQNEAGSRWKHHHNEKALTFVRRTAVTVPYPFAYGFIIGTTAADGCNVDCFVITRRSLASGGIVECEPVGLMEQFEDGEPDHNVLAAPAGERVTIDDAVRAALVHHVENVAGDHVCGKRLTVGRFLDASDAAAYITARLDKW